MGSDEADPLSVTAAALATVWLPPALATGGSSMLSSTVMVTAALLVALPSLTVKPKPSFKALNPLA